jgi:hypothetical protein
MSKDWIDKAFESPEELLRCSRVKYNDFIESLKKEASTFDLELVADTEMVPGLVTYMISILGEHSVQVRKLAHDVLSDCRHALDQAVVSATRLFGSNSNNHLYFPFGRDESDFDTLFKNKGRCRNVHRDLIPLLRRMQPWWYDESSQSGNDTLRTLSLLSGPSKHTEVIGFSNELVEFNHPVIDLHEYLLFFLIPQRSDRVARDNPQFFRYIKVEGRTDYIIAVATQKSSNVVDFKSLKLGFVAIHPDRIKPSDPRPLQDYPIDMLFNDFVCQSEKIIADIKEFCRNKISK